MSGPPGLRQTYAFSEDKKMRRAELEADIQSAVNAAFAPDPSRFSRVVVLTIKFDNYDLDVGALEKELGDTFSIMYEFDVNYVPLDSTKKPG
ncbi:hypothetical protein PMIN03_010275 [Paraphaeosphaeria minitans]|uniref:Uncharacterized protein n=1 Tax=Paraphaeosphaeria minitans TaxID=565426 RepID=A0A9P6KL69_9PLEO|nr:hypothetical protein PMIN01_11394 [Paraphaeosphaeria minitans]